jgi:PAS domain S-box-containing protein
VKAPAGFASIEDFLTAFTGIVGGLVSYVDAAGRVQYASQALVDWLETTQEDIRGQSLAALYGPETYPQFASWTDRALAGEDVHYERQATRPDGSPVWLSVNLRPHRDASGKVLGYFSCALEVEELKRTHDALGRALDELATHIENTPLAVVEWSADIAVKRWSPQAASPASWASCTRIRSRTYAPSRASFRRGTSGATACSPATSPRTAAPSGASGTTPRSTTTKGGSRRSCRSPRT